MSDLVDLSQSVEYEIRGSVALLWVKNPPVNALSSHVRQGLSDGIKKALDSSEVKSIILICRGRTFIAGADIKEFGQASRGPDMNQTLRSMEQSSKPIIAAIHGTAFGGGLEFSMACHYRIAVATAQCGQPEVKIGIIPGAGGTQRLPRLIGAGPAADMIVTGDPMPAAKAYELGLIDEMVEGDLAEAALAFAQKVQDRESHPVTRNLEKHIEAAKKDPGVFAATEKWVARKSRGALAPVNCLKAVKASIELPFDEGIKRERELFAECMASPQSGAMRYVFFGERQVNKIPDVPKDTETLPIKSVAIFGAGTMGGGIAMVFANAGFPVLLLDQAEEYLKKGLKIIQGNYASTVKKGRLSQHDMDQRLALITTSTRPEDISDKDLVIEAVYEEMALKKKIFAQFDKICRKDAIMATNTSTLDVNDIASATSRPEQVIGLHFFSPANVMKLLEIVRGDKTSKTVVATSMKLAKVIEKVGVLVRVCNGFVGNRMLHPYGREANYLVQEGALPQQVDKVITGFGLAMGPFAMSDLAGLDIGWRIRKELGPPPKGARQSGYVADRLADQGHFGQKTGKGFYRYEKGSRTPIPDQEVEKIIVEASKELGIARRTITDEEILARCLYPLINEGAKILEEGIALRSVDIDTVWINGYGFPSHRGGPMYYADSIGTKKVYEQICKFEKEHGAEWAPSALLKKLAEEGKPFSSVEV